MAKKKELSLDEYLAELGRRGGRAKSEKKRKAGRENLKKARAAKLRRISGGIE